MGTTGGVERLKELLFDSETRTLSDLSQRVDQLFQTAGTEERFRDSVAAVLDGALRTAEVSRHAELSSAVAPLIVKTIKTEIRNSQDELVEAIYPVTGRIVQAYLTSALRDLANDINRRFELNPVMLRVRSLITGKTVAELAIAATQRLRLEEVYLIRRGSGELVARWPEAKGPSGGRDHVMSGVLAAINEYSSKALQDNGAALRQIDFGERRLYLRPSPLYLLAAKCSGTAAAPVESMLDDAFLTAMEDLQKSQALAQGLGVPARVSLKDTYLDLERRISKTQAEIAGRGVSPAKVLAWGCGLALVLWISWSAYVGFIEGQVRDTAARVIAENSDVASYPIEIDVGHLGRSVAVEGLTPTEEARSAVVAQLAAALPKSEVRDRLRALPNDIAVMEPKVESVRQEVADLEPEVAIVRQGVSTLEPQVAGVRQQVEGLGPEIAGVRQQVAALESATTRRLAQSALDRSVRRLEEAETVLAAIITADGNSQASIGTAAQATAKARQDVDALRDGAAEAKDAGDAASIKTANEVSGRVRDAGTVLLAAIGSDSVPAAAGGDAYAGDSFAAAAEGLADETERLARVSVALSQVLAFKRHLPPPPGPSPRERLEAWTRSHAVFFTEDTNYRDTALAAATLDELAQLMRETDVLVRVVGYTDFKGGNERNSPLSEARADKVLAALIERGIPAKRLSAVGRKDNQDLSRVVGETSPNRRVQFEVGFQGEGAE